MDLEVRRINDFATIITVLLNALLQKASKNILVSPTEVNSIN